MSTEVGDTDSSDELRVIIPRIFLTRCDQHTCSSAVIRLNGGTGMTDEEFQVILNTATPRRQSRATDFDPSWQARTETWMELYHSGDENTRRTTNEAVSDYWYYRIEKAIDSLNAEAQLSGSNRWVMKLPRGLPSDAELADIGRVAELHEFCNHGGLSPAIHIQRTDPESDGETEETENDPESDDGASVKTYDGADTDEDEASEDMQAERDDRKDSGYDLEDK